LFALLVTAANGNTEKVIFLAPASSQHSFPISSSLLESFDPNVLSPNRSTARKALPVAFPTTDTPRGLEYWYLLRHLNEAQRYEVRVCWVASQPTEFWLDVFELSNLPPSSPAALEFKRLLEDASASSTRETSSESVLALRVQAAADFYTSNQTLMQYPPPVNLDIILDPYFANVFPTSLGPTAVYITVLAILGWYISDWIWSHL
ncbi:hypothetical protein BDY17DRAFT_231434, partial [Neohortaea acidophila]